MRPLAHILSFMIFLVTLSHNVGATRQTCDIIIIDQLAHKLNKVLLYQLDSATYDALQRKLDFNASSYSGNWRGHISTFVVQDNKLFLNSIEGSKTYTDFKGLLNQYKDMKGRILASWVSGTIICSFS